jgi:multiple sugar transport system permease protein
VSQRAASAPATSAGKKSAWWLSPAHAIAHLGLIAISALALLPMAWMLSTSLKAKGTELEWPIRWIPDPIVWQNYLSAHTILPFNYYYRNTVTIAILACLGTVITTSMAGYAFARLRFVGRGPLFIMVMATMMLPGIVTLIPSYIIWRTLGWIDTLVPLIVPSWLAANGGSYSGAFCIFLFRQFFMTLPYDLDDAARVDGASNYRILFQILLPLCGPVIAAVGIFTFVDHWTEFLGPLIYLNSDRMRTVSIGLALGSGTFRNTYNYIMAVAFVMTLPIVVLFFSAQRYFMKGIVMTGMAGR